MHDGSIKRARVRAQVQIILMDSMLHIVQTGIMASCRSTRHKQKKNSTLAALNCAHTAHTQKRWQVFNTYINIRAVSTYMRYGLCAVCMHLMQGASACTDVRTTFFVAYICIFICIQKKTSSMSTSLSSSWSSVRTHAHTHLSISVRIVRTRLSDLNTGIGKDASKTHNARGPTRGQ